MSAKPPTEYWFARRFPIGNGRGGMAPVHWKGWLVAVGFVIGLLAAGGVFAWYALDGEMLKGAAAFAALAFASAVTFIGISQKKGDHVHSVADYREGRVRV